jgi:hypothetical protein
MLGHNIGGDEAQHQQQPQRHQHQIVQIAEHRHKVGDEIDRRQRIGDDADPHHLGVPRHPRIAHGERDRHHVPFEIAHAFSPRHRLPVMLAGEGALSS